MSKVKISDELYNLIADNTYIQQVHFTKSGEHYLNIHELIEEVPSKTPGRKGTPTPTGKFYGRLIHKQVMTHQVGDKSFFKEMKVAFEPARIVETLTRDQIFKNVPTAGTGRKMMDQTTYYISELQRAHEFYLWEVKSIRDELWNSFPHGLEDMEMVGLGMDRCRKAREMQKLIIRVLEKTGGMQKDIALNALAGNLILN